MTPELEHLPNRLSKFDQEISDAFGGDDSTADGGFTIFHAGFLLSTIVSHSTSVGQMDPKYRDARAALTLLKSDNKLVALLKAAWEKKSFVEVQTDSRLSLKPHLHAVTTSSDISSTQVVSEAWKTPYIGNYHELLFNNINEMNRSGFHSNSVAIVQSSGYGKSRMVEEQSDLVFTIPFNLRSPWESSGSAYPPSDGTVYDHLTVSLSVEECHIRYIAFFCAVFQQVTIELEDVDKQDSYESLARSWRLHLKEAGNRSRIYGAAIDRAKHYNLNTIRDEYRARYPEVNSIEQAISKAAQDALDALLKKMALWCKSHDFTRSKDVKVMIYFDEAHVLAPGSDGQRGPDRKTNYDVMCSCFNLFLGSPFFAILLSTNSSLNRMAPPGSQAISARARQNPENLQAPITETPFDCSPGFPLEPGKLRLHNLYTIETLASFGRPLFRALVTSSVQRGAELTSSIITFTRSKILCDPNIHKPVSGYSDSAKMALVDIVLTLDFEPSREKTRKREAELVASHMRTVYSVPQDRAFMRSGYPSEPLLAEAAAQQIHAFQRHPTQTMNVMAELLYNTFEHGFLDQGQRGEIVCRLLLMTAYMRSVVKDHPDSSPNFSKGCKLVTFITELFTEECSNQVLISLPDNIKSNIPFSGAFSHAVIRFTHFGRMADDSGVTTYASLAAFIRGMAMIGWSSQAAVDIMIPILLDPTKTLSESVMSSILVQVKRRKDPGPKAAYEIKQKKLGVFPPKTLASDRPYITIVAELGVQPLIQPGAVTHPHVLQSIRANRPQKPGAVTHPHVLQSIRAKRPQKPGAVTHPHVLQSIRDNRPQKLIRIARRAPPRLEISPQPKILNHPTDTHPRYSIFAYGCSSNMYKVIDSAEVDMYKFLLGCDDLLGVHPRQDEASLDALRQHKPFWTIGKQSYHWIKNVFLNDRVELGVDPDVPV